MPDLNGSNASLKLYCLAEHSEIIYYICNVTKIFIVMEIPDFIKHLTPNQRDVTFSFFTLYPIYFTILYLYIDEFTTIPFHIQCIISMSTTIICLCLQFVVMASISMKINLKMLNVGTLTLSNINFAMFMLCRTSYIFNFWVCLVMFLINILLPIPVILYLHKKASKKDKANNN